MSSSKRNEQNALLTRISSHVGIYGSETVAKRAIISLEFTLIQICFLNNIKGTVLKQTPNQRQQRRAIQHMKLNQIKSLIHFWSTFSTEDATT